MGHTESVLIDFIGTHREAIIAGARARVTSRACPGSDDAELEQGIPAFLDQIGVALGGATSVDARRDDVRRIGLTIAQLVHNHGEVCQAITELAVEKGVPIAAEELRTLRLCLDAAIAHAITEYSLGRSRVIAAHGSGVLLRSPDVSSDALRR